MPTISFKGKKIIGKGEKGDTGESGVYIGTDEPLQEDVKVWINPSGTGKEDYGNYSTEEQMIGTWIDGKPLYRKVFIFQLPSSGTDVYGTPVLSIKNSDIKDITNARVITTDKNNNTYIFNYPGTGNSIPFCFFISDDENNNDKLLYIVIPNDPTAFGNNATLILEYTKN